MTPLQIFTLLSAIAGATKSIMDVMNELQTLGQKPDALIPMSHIAKIRAALATIDYHSTGVWEETHAGE